MEILTFLAGRADLSTMSSENVEFKTMDGVTLRGRIYPASQVGIGIVISPGVCADQWDTTSIDSY